MQLNLSRLSKNMAPEFGSGQSGNNRYTSIFHFFGLRENPFHISPDPRYLSFTRQTQEAVDALTNGILTGQGLMVLTGEVGTGKTTLTNYLLNWLRQRQTPTSFIFNPRLNVSDLFNFMLADFGITCESNQKADQLALLTEWLLTRCRVGKTPILIIDEAHGLPSNMLEEIRLLLNLETPREKLLQIVLVGQPELDEKLRRSELRQLRQRVMVHCKIVPLNSTETRGYIHRRVHLAGGQGESVFMSDAMDAVHSYSCGIPRVINILCEHALINAYADHIRPVSPQIVKEVAQEFQFDKIEVHDAGLDFNKTRSAGATSTRSISTAKYVHSLGATKSVSTEQSKIPMNHPAPVVDKNSVAPAAPVTNEVQRANTSFAARVAPWRRWMARTLYSSSSYLRRLWRDKGTGMPSFPILQHAASSMVGWLQQPVRPVRVRRRINQGPASGHLRRKIIFARVHGDIRKWFARFWDDAKARLES
jgi:general secretion pathway protein A